MRHEVFNEIERAPVFSELSQALEAAAPTAQR
jgi:hypothetical protein